MAVQVRLALLCALFVGCAAVLVFRLYTFQVLETSRYQQLADGSFMDAATIRCFPCQE